MAFEINYFTANIALVHGVTDGSANTALDNLAPNPWQDARVFAEVEGKGCYVEDINSDKPEQSGVLAATIDVRSSVASASFKCKVTKLTSGEGHVRDHSTITT
jgi:hypothetical protein